MADARQVMRFILRSGKRVAVLVIGLALLAAGLVMIVTPGPGLIAIIAGLAVLATEFAWAQALLDRTRDKANAAKEAVTGKRKRGGAEG